MHTLTHNVTESLTPQLAGAVRPAGLDAMTWRSSASGRVTRPGGARRGARLLVRWLASAMVGAVAMCAVAASAQPPAAGQGAGYHDPRSPIAPLKERAGVISWAVLSAAEVRWDRVAEKQRVTFPGAVLALNGKRVTVQGFMMPLEPGDRQRHFILSAVPTSCSFCVPAGPEGLIEVKADEAVRYGQEAITLSGELQTLSDDPYGVLYRLVKARQVP